MSQGARSLSPRGWRGRADVASANQAKKTWRVVLTVLLLGLVVALAWLLIWMLLHARVHFVCLSVGDYGVGAVPPIGFQDEDVAGFRNACASDPDVPLLGDIQTSETMMFLGDRLSGIVTGSRDTLILYLSAHGVSDDGEPYLLCSDFLFRRQNVAGRYPLREVFNQVQRCPAKLKLLILDAGAIEYDPRLGMVVNEFPRLVDAQLRERADPSLWVLLANGPFQRRHLAYNARRSVFSWFVAEGLRGGADADGDGMVGLAELADFTGRGVADWVYQDTEGHERQTVELLHAGEGAVQPPEDLNVLKVASLARGAEAEDEAADEEPDPSATKQAAAQRAARAAALAALADAWAVRDEVRERRGPGGWSPVDYAPHLWRVYEETLLAYEERWRGGRAFPPTKLAEEVKTGLLPCRELLRDGETPPGAGRTAVLEPLAAAQREFRGLGERTGLLAISRPDELAVVRAVQLKNDLTFRAPYYVRWHAAASLGMTGTHRLYEPLARMLEDLRRFADALESLEAAAGREGASVGEIEPLVEGIRTKADSLADLGKEIDTGLEEDARSVLEGAKAPGSVEKTETLLGTPCLSGPTRVRLLERLDVAAGQPEPGSEGPSADPAAGAGRPWHRLAEQARLEALLAATVDPAADVAPPRETPAADPPDALWQGYREFGARLRTFHEGLPSRVTALLGSQEPPDARLAERLLRLVDARDADQITKSEEQIRRRAVAVAARRIVLPSPPAPEPTVAETPPPPVEEKTLPDQVDLVVSQTSDRHDVSVAEVDGEFRLRPFPNRVTGYRLDLVNRSGKARKVSAQLVSVPSLGAQEPISNEVLLDASGTLRDTVKLLTPPLEASLPADASPVAVPFPAPPPPAAEEAKDAKEKPGGTKEEAPAKEPPVIPARLALVIRDLATGEAKWIKRLRIVPYAPRNYVSGEVAFDARQRTIVARFSLSDPTRAPSPLAEKPIEIAWQTEGLLDPSTPGNFQGKLATADGSATLTAEIPADSSPEGKLVQAHFKVDGVPRAFVYQVRCDRDRMEIERDRSLKRIKITAPPSEQAYRAPRKEPVPVDIAVDAPEDAFRDLADFVEVGIDRNADRELSGEKTVRFLSDRQVDLYLDELAPGGRMRIGARVDDFHVPLDFGDPNNMKVAVLAQLVLSRGENRIAASDSINVIFDSAPPKFTLDVGSGEATQGEPLDVSVRVDQELSGVQQIVFGLDRDEDGKLQEKEQPAKVTRASPDGSWHHQVATKDLPPAVYQLLVIATDRAGNEAPAEMRYLTVKPPPEKPVAQPKPTLSTIEGTVAQTDGKPLRGITVTLEGLDWTATTDRGGAFRFEQVPHRSKYTLHAKGAVKGKMVETTKEITLPGPDEPAKIRITMQW